MFGRGAFGLLQDFWKDGGKAAKAFAQARPFVAPQPVVSEEAEAEAAREKYTFDPRVSRVGADGLWQALPGEISEKMWGHSHVLPGDDFLTETVAASVGS